MVRQSLISGLLVLALVLPAACAAPPAATGESAGSTESAARARALLLLDSDNPGSRREGYAVLGAVGIDDDLPRLYTALYDADPVVRAIAENAIWHIWGRSGDAEIDRRFSIALEQMETGKLRAAVGTLSAIIEARPTFTEAWNKRATVYFLLGEDERSIADCDEVLARNPLHFGALAGYAQLMVRQRDFDRALKYFERALTVNPNMSGVAANIDLLRDALQRERGQPI